MNDLQFGDVSVQLDQHVGLVEIHRPPHNHFDGQLITNLADAFESMERERECRAIVLMSEGKSFCAGADFHRSGSGADPEPAVGPGVSYLYGQAIRLFEFEKPIVAAIQGAAVGGGLGLALVADFRVVSPEARLAANFVKLGIHPGFGLTYTLPRLVGDQAANLMFLTGRRITGEQAVELGLADVLAAPDALRAEAKKLADEIAQGAPLAVRSTRATLRRGLVEAIKLHTDHELAEQLRLMQTEDHKEGVLSVSERRPGRFTGR